ncbi:uncharacterized protein LOC125053890 [Pieris napi]|uniref:uncharacterized protein LOC125053890 n=1 Tax=Pieris napi TaxID=78633 RepID=UPI001FBA5102|nr:uncharacterized protein LOC125053890 [Pieris napi]
MSDQDKKSGTGTTPVVVEQTTNSRHKAPCRPNDIQDETDHHHKHSKAPAVQSVGEDVKHKTAEDLESENEDDKDRKRVKSNEMSKQSAAKKLSFISKKQGTPADSTALGHVELETKKGTMTPTSQPIPQVAEALSRANFGEKENTQTGETDSITEEISEARIVKPSKRYSNWSDDEEAGGLPRSESRASRVSRVVRQFFCCGVPYEAPSEENISSGRAFGQGI